MVLDDRGDRLHIGYLAHDAYKAEQLGYWQVDRGVFELVAPRTEISEILEERSDYPRASASGSLANGRPMPGTGYSHSSPHPIPAIPQPGFTEPQTPPRPAEPQPSAVSGQYAVPTAYPGQDQGVGPAPVLDETTGVALPVTTDAPLPLEAEALRAASASRRPHQPSAQTGPTPHPSQPPAAFQAGQTTRPGLTGQPPPAPVAASPAGPATR